MSDHEYLSKDHYERIVKNYKWFLTGVDYQTNTYYFMQDLPQTDYIGHLDVAVFYVNGKLQISYMPYLRNTHLEQQPMYIDSEELFAIDGLVHYMAQRDYEEKKFSFSKYED